MKNKKVIGILGGMGPSASAYLYKRIIELAISDYGAKNNDDFPEIVLYSVPVPAFISSNKNKEKAFLMLEDRTKRLNKIGVDVIGIACNTVHVLLPELQKVSKARFVSMIDAVVQEVEKLNIKTIGLLGTSLTIQSRLYQSRLKDTKIVYTKEQKTVDTIIKKILAGKAINKDKDKLVSIADDLKQKGAEAILLGCTELPLLFPKGYGIPVVRSTDMLARVLLKETMI